MQRVLLAALAAVSLLPLAAQKVDKGTRFEKLDATGSTYSKPFRAVTVDPTGSCSNSDEVVINSITGVMTHCKAGTWATLGGAGTFSLGSNGIAVQTPSGPVARTFVGVAGRTFCTNCDGTAGNPAYDIYPNPSGQLIPFGFMLGADDGSALVDTNDQKDIFSNQLGFPTHLMKVFCRTDTGTATINLQRNDGSPANILAADLPCTSTGASTTTFVSGENALADGMSIDLVVVTAATSGTPHRISVYGRLSVD